MNIIKMTKTLNFYPINLNMPPKKPKKKTLNKFRRENKKTSTSLKRFPVTYVKNRFNLARFQKSI